MCIPTNPQQVSVRNPLNELCDQALVQVVKLLEVKVLICVGKYTQARAQAALKELEGKIRVEMIMHPSPINPVANKVRRKAWID